MIFRLKRPLATARFNLKARGVRGTPPLAGDPASPVVLVSQVCHRDVSMYLLAVKSLARFVRPEKVFVLDDTSLTERDKATLRRHIRPLELLPITTVKNDSCPNGKTWERLLFIADIVPSHYVIQVDSDTLTLRRPKEVLAHIRDDTSFTLGEWQGQEIVSIQEASAQVKSQVKDGTGHVQLVSEANLDGLVCDKPLRYVRGSSGFAGFARNSFTREAVEHFSMNLSYLIGWEKWNEWGSEQVTSNFIVANTPKAAVLPFPEYCHHHPGLDVEPRAFVHFIGTYRFRDGRYARLARRVIRELAHNG